MAEMISDKTFTTAGATYDETPYPSSPFPQTHPDKLCAMARLFGLAAPALAQARVLELGCADGANLLPMAQHTPYARFLGIDASAKQVASAQLAIKAAGLTNVEIRHQDILDFPASEGKFDYVIVHGLFSWVPDEVRSKILTICREHLMENGVAYVSYNAFPGWGMRMALRDMAMFHTRNLPDSKQKVQQARALTAFLAESVKTDNNPYGLLLRQELDRMKDKPDNYLRHDLLEEINQPFYFHQFIARASKAGLQYLGEPSLDQMLASNFPEKVQETLKKIGSNLIAQEQYMDFVRNRNFRQTLLCHREAKLTRNIAPETLKSFYYISAISAPATAAFDPKHGVAQQYQARGATITVEDAFLKAAFNVLAEHGVRRISFPELLQESRKRIAGIDDGKPADRRAVLEEATLLQNLSRLYARGVVDVFAERPEIAATVPPKPLATPLARYQALHGRTVTTRGHNPASLELLPRYILAACDGARDRAGLVDHLVALTKQGKLRLAEKNQPVTDEAQVRAILDNRVGLLLPSFTAAGFF